MLPRLAAGALLASAAALATLGAATARAEPAAASHGVVVVSVGDDATPAARPLALEVYRDPALRPGVDDATARVLAGEPAAEGSPQRLKDLGTLRASLAQPADPTGDPGTGELVQRRLLASIGAEAHAAIVLAVTMRGGRPSARALKVSSGAYEGVEIGATTTASPDGTAVFTWPGAVTTLRALLPPEPAPALVAPRRKTAPPAATTPAKDTPEKAKDRSFWSSPWFWVGLGAVVATGVTVFVVTNETQSDSGTIHVDGRVPR